MTFPSPGLRRPAIRARGLFALALVLAACGGLATLVDLPVARFISARSNGGDVDLHVHGKRRIPGDVVRLLNLSEVFGYSPSAGIILLAALLLDPSLVRARKPDSPGKTPGDRGKWCPPVSLSPDALRMVGMTFSGGLTTDLLKMLITRVRPYAADLALHASASDTFSNVEGVGGVAMRSFPSGHAAVAAGLASALCWRYPRGSPLFIPIAIAAAAQRLTSSSHYVSDVTIGAAIAVAWASFWLWSAERPDHA